MNTTTTIVLIDDRSILRKGLRLSIEHHPWFRIMGVAERIRKASKLSVL